MDIGGNKLRVFQNGPGCIERRTLLVFFRRGLEDIFSVCAIFWLWRWSHHRDPGIFFAQCRTSRYARGVFRRAVLWWIDKAELIWYSAVGSNHLVLKIPGWKRPRRLFTRV